MTDQQTGHHDEYATFAPGEANAAHPARYWHPLPDGRVQCDLCPRECRLREGQRGFCFVRMREGDRLVLATYGRSSGFCIDPIEKKPLNHFYPGSSVLSFGTAGCNLGCRFCQNWDITKSRETDRLMDQASPEQLARAAAEWGCRSIAFTYNDPAIFLEYAVDVGPGLPRARHPDRRGERGLPAPRAAPRAVLGHGRRQHRPQGLRRRLLRAPHRGRTCGRCSTPSCTCATRPTRGSRSRRC